MAALLYHVKEDHRPSLVLDDSSWKCRLDVLVIGRPESGWSPGRGSSHKAGGCSGGGEADLGEGVQGVEAQRAQCPDPGVPSSKEQVSVLYLCCREI